MAITFEVLDTFNTSRSLLLQVELSNEGLTAHRGFIAR